MEGSARAGAAPLRDGAIFGLGYDDLRSVVGRIAGGPVTSIHVRFDHELYGSYGYRADKLIPTFEWRTEGGDVGSATVFVKRQHQQRTREDPHYRQLASLAAPIPEAYGVLEDPQGREVLLLEHVFEVLDLNVFFEEAGYAEVFLDAMARLNALRPDDDYGAWIPAVDLTSEQARMTQAATDLDVLWRAIDDGDLGPRLRRLLLDRPGAPRRLRELARGIPAPLDRMERGLQHCDLWAGNTGWRRTSDELLIVDLESVAWMPALYDLARYLGPPSQPQATCLPYRELVEHYADRFEHWGGVRFETDDLVARLELLWARDALAMLPWWCERAIDGVVDFTGDRDEARSWAREELHRRLCSLIDIHEAGLSDAFAA